MKDGRGTWVALASVAAFLVGTPAAQATTVTISLDVSSGTPTSGNWSAGTLVPIIITAESDGSAAQDEGVYGADFQSSDFGITVADTGKVKVHDVLYAASVQVDKESDATSYDGNFGYVKADDTWVYEEFERLLYDAEMADGSFEATARLKDTDQTDLGIGAPVDFAYLVLEVQSGFLPGQSTSVTFKGQVIVAGGFPEENTRADIFGTTSGSAVGEGSFTLTNIPEPATGVLVLVGLGALLRRRRT
jgi:hypothetical protein